MSSPALKKKNTLAALVPHPQRCRMAIPDPHFFSRTEDVHKQGWPARRGWRAPERGGDAAPRRSAGAQSGPRGRAGAAGPGQWGAPRRREPVVSEPPVASRSPRAACPRVRGELASSAGELRVRAISSPTGRRALLRILPESPCTSASPFVSKPVAPNSVRSR